MGTLPAVWRQPRSRHAGYGPGANPVLPGDSRGTAVRFWNPQQRGVVKAACPKLVELSPREAALAAQIDFSPDYLRLGDRFTDVIQESCAAGAKLAKSLLARQAIPQLRIDYFTDPRLNIGTKLSRQGVFEGNGTCGDDILEHPNFLPYLRYFIHGPDLPPATIDGFCRIVQEDRGTSGMVLDQLHRYARREIRERGLSQLDAAEEFFKLALECGLGVDRARGVRKAALKAK